MPSPRAAAEIEPVVWGRSITYHGPAGSRVVDTSAGSASAQLGFAVGADGTAGITYAYPLVEYDPKLCDFCTSLGHHYGQLRQAFGPAFEPAELARTAENDTGYLFNDLAVDRRTGALHAAYGVGRSDLLVHHAQDGRTTALSLRGVRGLRIAAGGGVVAIAATDGNRLLLFQRRSGGWSSRTLARGVNDFDMAVGRDGRARAVFSTTRDCCSLRVWTGSRLIRTRVGVDQVALAVDDRGAAHIAYSRMRQLSCRRVGWWGRVCSNNGVGYLKLTAAGRPVRHSVVQSSMGYSSNLSVAVTAGGGKVAIGYPDAGRDRRALVRIGR